MSRTALDITPEDLRAALESELAPTLGGARVVEVRPLAKARGATSFVLTTDAGAELQLKLAELPQEIARFRATSAVVRAALRGGVPVPKIIAIGAGRHPALRRRPWLVQEYLPGQDAEDAWPSLSESARTRFCVGLGRATGKLHGVPGPGFTEANLHSRDADWSAHVNARLARVEKKNRQAGALAPPELARARARIELKLADSAGFVQPRLAHRDLLLRNALTSPEGEFVALLDLEHARYTDPLMEFVRLESGVFARFPGTETPFREGYAETGPGELPEATARLEICRALEWLGAIPFLVRAGDEKARDEAVARLKTWLDSD